MWAALCHRSAAFEVGHDAPHPILGALWPVAASRLTRLAAAAYLESVSFPKSKSVELRARNLCTQQMQQGFKFSK
jgi:hypothetical protein